ncbi:MAG TPA: hypothetical protein VGA87_09490, partial [Pyrinomonadaceae bacterium]
MLEAVAVARDGARLRVELRLQADGFRLRRGAQRIDHGRHDACEVNRAHVEAQLARDDARDVEQIIDEFILRLRVALDDL